MPDLKISQLTDGNPAQTNDQIPINRAGVNFSITAGSIVSLATTNSATTQVLFNLAGVVTGDPQFTFNPTGDVLSLTGQWNIDNIRVDGNVISSTNTNGNIDLTPNGTGRTTVTNLTTTSPRIVTGINDTNGNELFLFTATASAVNEFSVTNGATGTGATLAASGGDTNINLRLAPKGTGQVQELVSATYYALASQYDVGTAPNQIPLNQYLGTMAFQDAAAVSVGQLRANATAGIGYALGAGSAVTQITSRTTGVTINAACGAITLFSAAGSATFQSFTVTNSSVAATDNIIVNQKSGTDLNLIHVTNIAAGSFQITFATTGGTTIEQPVFNFSVIKAVAA
jgi:hypothetical protein